MSDDLLPSFRARVRQVLIGAMAGWPTLTLVIFCTQPFTQTLPLPLRALVSAAAMAVLMNLVSVPFVRRLVARLEGSGDREVRPMPSTRCTDELKKPVQQW